METRNHHKNGAVPKSQMSRVNLDNMKKIHIVQFAFFAILVTFFIDSSAHEGTSTCQHSNGHQNKVAPANLESTNSHKLAGTIWQMQMDESKDKGGVLKNISFGTKGVMLEVPVYYNDGYLTKIGEERSTIYRETPTGVVVFDKEGENPFFKKVKWINEDQITYEGYNYARLGSGKDTFTKDYTEHYIERIVENGGSVNAYFLQNMAIKYCRVNGKEYQLKGEPVDSEGYINLEFRNDGSCSWQKSKHFSFGFKDYIDHGSSLWFRPYKPFAKSNRGEWDEKWEVKWLNCQEFILSKDGKSYHYIYKGKAKQEESSSY